MMASRPTRSRSTVLLETLESRDLLSAAPLHASANAFAHANIHSALFKTPTPIADLTGTGLTITAVVGIPGNRDALLPAVQDVATLTSVSSPINLKGYSVSIDWGDGKITKGRLVVDKAGVIHVKGAHAYQAEGTFPVTVTLTQTEKGPKHSLTTLGTLVINSTANVTQNSSTGVTITPTAGVAFTGSVGTFTIPPENTTTDPATFKAYIKWGDRGFSLGTVTLNQDGSYTVTGTHTYATAGTYRVSVFVVQNASSTTSTVAKSATSDDDFEDRCHATFIAAIFSTATVTSPTV